MKNRKLSHSDPQQHRIPDLDIIDLEAQDAPGDARPGASDGSRPADGEPDGQEDGKKRGPASWLNIHTVLLAVAVLFVAGIVYKVMTFGEYVDLDEIFSDGPGEYSDTYDTILPLLDDSNNPVYKDYSQGATILAFGNAPFADDRGSEDNLVRLMEKETGATIYNCSVSGSLMTTVLNELHADTVPWDVFNAYWLCNILAGSEKADAEYLEALELLGDEAPPEAREVYDTLKSIDLDDVDVIVVMYDASDYLAGRPMSNPGNATDITTFAGNTEAIIEYLHYFAPDTRVIIMSPTYAFALDDNGEYISSDMKRYGQDVLSIYAILQYASCVSRSTTFVDNIYNTINEDNAKKYLEDNLHLNLKGRKKVAERFAYALNYYNQDPRSAGSRE